MLDLKQHLARVEIDDVDEAVFVLAVLHADEAELAELLVGAGEVGDVDLDVVAVIGRDRPVGLAEQQVLAGADGDAGEPPGAVVLDRGRAPP